MIGPLISLLLAASSISPVQVCNPQTSPAQCASIVDGGLAIWSLNGSGGGGGGGSVTQGTIPWVIQGWIVSDGGFVQVTQGTSPWVVNGTVAATQSGNWTVYANNDGGITVFQGTNPFQVRPSNAYGRSSTTTYLTLFRINQDVAQTLNEQIEVSANQAGPYKALPNNDLQNLAPGATALTTVETKGYDWVRTTGTASGAGLNVSATSVAYTDDP